MGQVATREGKLDEAITHFNKAIEINPDKFEYNYGLAAAYRTKQDYAKAIATMNNAETQATTPQNQYYLYLERGLSYLSIRQWDRAAGDLQKAVQLQPQEKMANQRYGMALFRLEDYAGAAEHLRKAATKDSKDTTTLSYLARAAINLGQRETDPAKSKTLYAEAVRAAQAANAAKPGVESEKLLAKSYLGAGQYDQAARSYQKVLKAKPGDCFAQTDLGQAYIALEAWPQAVAALEKASNCDPKSTISLNLLAYALVKENRKQEALAAYEKSFAMKPDPKVAEHMDKVANNIEIDQENAAIEAFNSEQQKLDEAEQAAFEKKQAEFEAEQKRIKEYKEKDN